MRPVVCMLWGQRERDLRWRAERVVHGCNLVDWRRRSGGHCHEAGRRDGLQRGLADAATAGGNATLAGTVCTVTGLVRVMMTLPPGPTS